MNKSLVSLNTDSKLALNKVKKLINITNKILSSKHDSVWIEKLLVWFQKNIIQEKIYFPGTKNELLNLKILSLRWNRLKTLPSELFQMIWLENLELNNNNLESIPREIGNLQNLKSLNLNLNSLKSLPTEIILLKQLEALNIKNNKYLELNSKQIGWLKELKKNGCNIIYDKYKFNLGE